MRLDVKLGCDIAQVAADASEAFRASADQVFNRALEEVKEMAAAFTDGERSAKSTAFGTALGATGPHSLAARAARSVSEALAGIASVLIVSEAERAEAERLVGAHRTSARDKDPLAPVVVNGRLAQPVIVASGAEADEYLSVYGRAIRGT